MSEKPRKRYPTGLPIQLKAVWDKIPRGFKRFVRFEPLPVKARVRVPPPKKPAKARAEKLPELSGWFIVFIMILFLVALLLVGMLTGAIGSQKMSRGDADLLQTTAQQSIWSSRAVMKSLRNLDSAITEQVTAAVIHIDRHVDDKLKESEARLAGKQVELVVALAKDIEGLKGEQVAIRHELEETKRMIGIGTAVAQEPPPQTPVVLDQQPPVPSPQAIWPLPITGRVQLSATNGPQKPLRSVSWRQHPVRAGERSIRFDAEPFLKKMAEARPDGPDQRAVIHIALFYKGGRGEDRSIVNPDGTMDLKGADYVVFYSNSPFSVWIDP